MPWSNQSGGGNAGGPWGSGPRGPWGQGPQGPGGNGGQGPNPPDLEELIRRGQDRLRHLLPSGGPLGVRSIGLLVLVALVLIWTYNSAFTVQPDEVGIVTRFGAYQAPPRQSGLNFILWPIEQVQAVKVTSVNQEEIGFRSGQTRQERSNEALMLTKDENIVSVGFTVSWSVRPDRPQDYVFNIAAQQETVRAVAESAMREVVGRNNAEDIIVRGQAILQAEVTRILQDTLDFYRAGIQINAVSISRPEVPQEVREAFNDVQQAVQDAQTFQNQARATANKVLADARGDAIQRLQEADGYAKSIVAEAQGQAQRFLAVYNEYVNAKEITRQRMFIETMERVLSSTNKVILDNAPNATGSGVLPFLPLPQLRPTETPATGSPR